MAQKREFKRAKVGSSQSTREVRANSSSQSYSPKKAEKKVSTIVKHDNAALRAKRTVPWVLSCKEERRKIVALTSYDYSLTKIIESANAVDIVLVGDSLGSIIQGQPNTLPVTLDEVIYHTRCVARGIQHALLVADLPFLSYQVSPEQALMSAGRLLKEGGAQAVKLEGGIAMAETIARLVAVDIPVMGHVGLTPQSYHRMGGHRIQGRSQGKLSDRSGELVLRDAKAVEEAGAFAIVLEGIPAELASEITNEIRVPTIGIGAGADCDGQILVAHDMLGYNQEFAPRFVKRYRELAIDIEKAFQEYAQDVRTQRFPAAEHTFFDIDQAEKVRVVKK